MTLKGTPHARSPYSRLKFPQYDRRFTPLEEAGIERVLIPHRNFQQLGISVLRVHEDIPCLRDQHARNIQRKREPVLESQPSPTFCVNVISSAQFEGRAPGFISSD